MDRERQDSKRRISQSDRKGSYHHQHHSSSSHSESSRESTNRDRGHRSYHDYKKDRSHDHENHHRFSNESRHSSSGGSRYDDEKYSPRYQRGSSSSSNYKNERRHREYSSGSSYDSPYSTPPPAPPAAPSNQPPHRPQSMTAFISSNLDPRLSSKPKKEEPKQNFKLLIDPSLKKGHTAKIVRYDGVLAGQPPVVPKDPRRKKSKIWTIEVCDLPVPEYKLDKNFIGPMPRDTVRFSGLNDNVDRKFLHELCEIYGDIKEYKVYFDPKTNRHTGNGKVVFEENTRLDKVVLALNGRSVMGKTISAWIEDKPPPGVVLLKQLEAECLKKRTILREPPPPPRVNYNTLASQNMLAGQSSHLATPTTPNISSMQRTHPIAGHSMQENTYRQSNSLPPPPPPGHHSISNIPPVRHNHQNSMSGTPPPPPPTDGEDNSALIAKKNWYRNGKNLPPLELTRRQEMERPNSPLHRRKHLANRQPYSPLSNSSRSMSPLSPAVKDITPTEKKYTNFESISDNENSSMHVEDISPAGSPKNKLKIDDDDAMSLSSISSNEDPKVELNVKNLRNQNRNSPNLIPNPSQTNVMPPNLVNHSNINQSISNSRFPFTPNLNIQVPRYFPQQQGQMSSQSGLRPQAPPPSLMNWQPGFPPRQFVPPPVYPSDNNARFLPPANLPMDMNRPVSSSNNSSVNFNPVGAPSRQPYDAGNSKPSHMQQPMQQIGVYSNNSMPPLPPTPQVPVIPKELPFVFQVKAGCARDISVELKRILVRDTLKKLVEQSAFNTFESWWQMQVSSNKTKNINENSFPKLEKQDTDADRKLLSDKPINVQTTKQPPLQSVKDAVTTSALLQTLFGFDKHNENRPHPANNFLNSFRISRKQQEQPSMKATQISRKRRPWPALTHRKNKLQRLEDSSDDDDEEEDVDNDASDSDGKDDVDEEQFEMFARRQRQLRKSGSSLYQKVYSESEEEDEKDDSQTEDEDDDEEEEEEEKGDVSSAMSDESSETESSETESSETETDEEDEVEEEITGKTVSDDVNIPGLPLSKEKSSSQESLISHQSETTDEERVRFRSMYDEPRKRRAVQKAEERLKEVQPKPKTPKPPRPTLPAKKRIQKTPRITEESETETADELTGSEDEQTSSEDEVEVTRNVKKEGKKTVNKNIRRVEQVEEEKIPTEEELLHNLILLEHNYFVPLPVVEKPSPKRAVLDAKQITQSDEESEDLYEIPPIKFLVRSDEEENSLVWDIMKNGIDDEDLCYLKEAYDNLQDSGSKEFDHLSWSDHPPTSIVPYKPKRSKGEHKLRVHQSGCARSEGYYKIPIVEKACYLKSALRTLKRNILQQKHEKATTGHKMKSRENRAMQRRLASSIAQEEFGTLINYNQTLKMRKKALRFAKSSIHNWGLFTCETIPADQFVCEYVGQMIRAIVAEVREISYTKSGIGSSYLFRLDMESVIDATKNGCNARFINHSCQPNCYAKVILVEGAKKIVIYSKRAIKLGEEITYDYKFPLEDEKIPCLCGAPGCRGSLN